jgi:hypothetical protein
VQYSNVLHLKINCYQLCHRELDKVPTEERIDSLLKIVDSTWFDNVSTITVDTSEKYVLLISLNKSYSEHKKHLSP